MAPDRSVADARTAAAVRPPQEEFGTLLKILPKYHSHVERHPHTLINRVVGAHELVLYGQRVRVMVVESCFTTSREIHERYDLKGSWVGRGGKILLKRGEVLKDRDVQGRFHLARDDAQRIAQHLRDDVAFLAAANVIDYSLLVGVTKTKFTIEGAARWARGAACAASAAGSSSAEPPFHRQDAGGIAAGYVEGAEFYCMGVIDILQDFNVRKRAEYLLKRFLCCRGQGVSVHPPAAYGSRFERNVVDALIQPARDGSLEPRIFRGFTPASLRLPPLEQQRPDLRVTAVPGYSGAKSTPSFSAPWRESIAQMIPTRALSAPLSDAETEPLETLLSSQVTRSDHGENAPPFTTTERQVLDSMSRECPSPDVVLAFARRCVVM